MERTEGTTHLGITSPPKPPFVLHVPTSSTSAKISAASGGAYGLKRAGARSRSVTAGAAGPSAGGGDLERAGPKNLRQRTTVHRAGRVRRNRCPSAHNSLSSSNALASTRPSTRRPSTRRPSTRLQGS
jgi:hypothetical protein